MTLRRKKKIGELLCEKSYLEESNLEIALAEQAETGAGHRLNGKGHARQGDEKHRAVM